MQGNIVDLEESLQLKRGNLHGGRVMRALPCRKADVLGHVDWTFAAVLANSSLVSQSVHNKEARKKA